MDQTSRAWASRLAVVVALVVGLLAAALPTSAAPSTKNYSASLSYNNVDGLDTVTVAADVTSFVTLVLTNLESSQQSFASAELTFTGTPLPSGVSVARAGWSVTTPTSSGGAVRYRVTNDGVSNPLPPGESLDVTIAMPGEPSGTTFLTTRVKQSNDFKGTNNDFALDPASATPLTIITPAFCAEDCNPPAYTSSTNKVLADLTLTSSSPFEYFAGFTTDRLSCDTIPFGPTVKPEPFQVETTFATAPVSKELVLIFPKALANLVPNNGTPHHPVCAGGDYPFPGSSTVGAITHPHEGLLLNCSDPAYRSAVADADPDAFLPMCVKSRSRSAGRLVVTVLIEESTVDPRIW